MTPPQTRIAPQCDPGALPPPCLSPACLPLRVSPATPVIAQRRPSLLNHQTRTHIHAIRARSKPEPKKNLPLKERRERKKKLSKPPPLCILPSERLPRRWPRARRPPCCWVRVGSGRIREQRGRDTGRKECAIELFGFALTRLSLTSPPVPNSRSQTTLGSADHERLAARCRRRWPRPARDRGARAGGDRRGGGGGGDGDCRRPSSGRKESDNGGMAPARGTRRHAAARALHRNGGRGGAASGAGGRGVGRRAALGPPSFPACRPNRRRGAAPPPSSLCPVSPPHGSICFLCPPRRRKPPSVAVPERTACPICFLFSLPSPPPPTYTPLKKLRLIVFRARPPAAESAEVRASFPYAPLVSLVRPCATTVFYDL